MHSACKWNNVECAEKLIEAGTNINAVSNGGKNLLSFLSFITLKFITHINCKYYIHLGITPLHLVAELSDSHNLIELLLSQPSIQPDVKLPNGTDDTPKDITSRKSINDRLFEYSEPCFNYI